MLTLFVEAFLLVWYANLISNLLISTTCGHDLVWFGMVCWFGFNWPSNLMWDGMQGSMGQHWLWVPLRVRQRMTEREPPLSSYRPYPSISLQSFHYFCLSLTPADEMVTTKCEISWAFKYSQIQIISISQKVFDPLHWWIDFKDILQ